MLNPADIAAVVIGRFQPFHNGHRELLEHALRSAGTVVVVLGSAFHARNAKNPFTCAEREEMILLGVPEAERQRVRFAPMRDYYDEERWTGAVRAAVAGQVPLAREIQLVGHFKDDTSRYLEWFPEWKLVPLEKHLPIDGAHVRAIYFEARDLEAALAVLKPLVPVTPYLRSWAKLPWYAQLAEEHRANVEYLAQWQCVPYAPIFVTVDAVVQACGHVLLVRRAGQPGKGLWALPGGFVEARERLLEAAMRELREETRLGIHDTLLRTRLQGVVVFDHPERATRGRTITHAHHFELAGEKLPEVEGGDDAARACWMPVSQLPGLEDQFFEDHFHILDHFLGMTPR
jgi:bifunctional NMN adenylyltransferase/nudix hydrolase